MKIEIVEVSPRDGLQNDPGVLSTAGKAELVDRALAAGLRRMEVVSFVHPGRVPRMADAEAVLDALRGRPDLRRIGLVLNRRGLDRALAAGKAGAGVDEVNFVVVASNTFGQRNQGATLEDGLRAWPGIAAAARAAGLGTSVTVATAFGCPWEGEVPLARVVEAAGRAAAEGADEVALADTIGVAAPTEVAERIEAVRRAAPGVRLRAHFHNTRNTGLANAAAAVAAGVHVLDASLGGIGGCPFAPAATGNIATEDLAYMLHRMGHDTGTDLPALIDAAKWLEARLGHSVPSLLPRAGVFPPARAAA